LFEKKSQIASKDVLLHTGSIRRLPLVDGTNFVILLNFYYSLVTIVLNVAVPSNAFSTPYTTTDLKFLSLIDAIQCFLITKKISDQNENKDTV
jgi:hypothetical protein